MRPSLPHTLSRWLPAGFALALAAAIAIVTLKHGPAPAEHVSVSAKRLAAGLSAHSPSGAPVQPTTDAVGLDVPLGSSTRLEPLRRIAAQLTKLGPEERDLADTLRRDLAARVNDDNAREIVLALGNDLDSELAWLALSRWAAATPVDAAQWLTMRAAASPEQIAAVGRGLAKNENALADWLASAPTGATAELLLSAIARATAAEHPARAVAVAEHLPAGPGQREIARCIADEWARRDPAAAQAWIAGIGDPSWRAELLDAAARGMAATDPIDAVEWVLGAPLPEPDRSRALVAIADAWRRFAPESATRFTALAGLAAE